MGKVRRGTGLTTVQSVTDLIPDDTWNNAVNEEVATRKTPTTYWLRTLLFH